MPVKHFDMQAAINTHLLQSNGIGAFDGQHGISLAISPDMADGDISSAACIDVAAITGNDIGPNARPAITSAASIWRMTKTTFTTLSSHKLAAKGSALLTVQEAAVLIGIKLPASICPHGFVSAAVPIPADQDRATRNRRNPQILAFAVRVVTGC
jgi:hypothetical protein